MAIRGDNASLSLSRKHWGRSEELVQVTGHMPSPHTFYKRDRVGPGSGSRLGEP